MRASRERTLALQPGVARRAAPAGAAVAGGLLLLLGRQLTTSPLILMVVLIGVAAVAVAPGLPRSDPASLAFAWVLGGGVALVGVAMALQGPAVPAPETAWLLPLSVLAAVAEEAFFRRLVYGGLHRWGTAMAIVGSAVLFALMHVPMYGLPAFWVDLGAGLLFGWQRWASGGWIAPAATHAVANVLAVLP